MIAQSRKSSGRGVNYGGSRFAIAVPRNNVNLTATMKSRQLFHVHPEKYRQLLLVLIFIFLTTPFLNHGLGEIVSGLMLFYTLIAIFQTIEIPRRFLALYMGFAALAFGLQIVAILNLLPAFYRGFGLIIEGIYALYLGGAAYWIAHDVFENPKASLDTVRGGVSVYLLLGFVWALLYGMVSIVDPNAFSPPLDLSDSLLTAMHFSNPDYIRVRRYCS